MLSIVEILKVVFLGIVEGVTEWLPISSTGHMLLVDEFIQIQASKEFKEMFFCCHPAWSNPCSYPVILEKNVAIPDERQDKTGLREGDIFPVV